MDIAEDEELLFALTMSITEVLMIIDNIIMIRNLRKSQNLMKVQ